MLNIFMIGIVKTSWHMAFHKKVDKISGSTLYLNLKNCEFCTVKKKGKKDEPEQNMSN